MYSKDNQGRKILTSPNENVAAKDLIAQETCKTKIKAIIVRAFNNNLSKSQVESLISQVIVKYSNEMSIAVRERIKRSLGAFAQQQYQHFRISLSALNVAVVEKLQTQYSFAEGKGNVIISDEGFRNKNIDLKGNAYIHQYRQKVKSIINELAKSSNKVNIVKPNGKVINIGGRNYAEMKVRQQANIDDLNKMDSDRKGLFWISSHADASPRCQPYQGLLVSRNSNLIGTTIDGHKVEDLDAIMSANGGNSIISGYNCRHYLIEYTKGSKAPVDYKSTKGEYKITEQQRNYENRIRQLKVQQRLAIEADNKKVAKALSERWHSLDAEYHAYSLSHNRQWYEWRTVVSDDEVETFNN